MSDLAVITRFHYPVGDPKFEWRFDYYANSVLPRLLDQSDNDFDIWVWCNPAHDELFRELERVNVFHGTHEDHPGWRFNDATAYSNLSGLPQYEIQFGLDSDELVSKEIVAKTKELCHGGQKLFISYQPVLLDLPSGNHFYTKRRYQGTRGSAIFAYYQPGLHDFKFAYHATNHEMPSYADRTIFVPEGYVQVTVHEHNDSTYIHRTARRYRGPLH